MDPTYFGDSERPLFGVYHAPAPGVPPSGRAVLLCYPMGQEYMRAHWAFRQLARRLSKSGIPVFRFDYSATGDSAGETGAATVSQWVSDVRAAAEELSFASGCKKLGVVGLRFGATLALIAASEGLACTELVLWHPIVSGALHLSELSRLHTSLLEDEARFVRPHPPPTGAGHELLGFAYSDALWSSIQAVDAISLPKPAARRVILVVEDADPGAQRLRDRLSEQGVDCGLEIAGEPGEWTTLSQVEEALIAHRSVAAIADSLAESGR
jgi:uncharacterized protein